MQNYCDTKWSTIILRALTLKDEILIYIADRDTISACMAIIYKSLSHMRVNCCILNFVR